MKNSKKLVNLISLVVLVATNILSPLSYVTAEDDLDIGDTASYGAEQDSGGESYDDSDESTDDDSEMAADSQLDGQDDEGDIDNSSEPHPTPLLIGEGSPDEIGTGEVDSETPMDSSATPQNDEGDVDNPSEPHPTPLLIGEGSPDEIGTGEVDNETPMDSSLRSERQDNTQEGQTNTQEADDKTEENSAIDILKSLFEDSQLSLSVIESEEIYGTGEYEGVKVEVYAQTGAFPLGTILNIIPITGDDEMRDIQDVLEAQKNVEKSQKVIAFDITFLDPETEEELQPSITGAVQVTFNYEENEELLTAEQDEEQEVKVYHLNDKDEEGEKIENITGTIVEDILINEEASEEVENGLVIDAESFSYYTIVVQRREEALVSAPTQTWQYGEDYFTINIARPSGFSSTDYPIEGFTIMDRNLGASISGTTCNTTNATGACGYLYQWGNNYGFPISANASSILTGVGLTWDDSYNNNGYVSKKFVNGNSFNYDVWSDSSHHDGVWGGANDVNYASTKNSNGLYWDDGGDRTLRQGPCPEGWHVPSAGEWSMLLDYWYYTNYTAHPSVSSNLYYFSDSTKRQAFMDYFYIPFAGYRNNSTASLSHLGSDGRYWSSSPYSASSNYARYLYLDSSDVIADNGGRRALGFSVRCFKDSYVASPESSNLVDTQAWVEGKDFETITISNPDNINEGFTIMDRNLGATTGNIASTGSYGFKYQWGNNYGFVDGCTSNGCSDDVTSVTAGLTYNSIYDNHGYYSTSFINGSSHDKDVWSDGSHHDGVWGGANDSSSNNRGANQINPTDRQGPCPEGWHVPSAGEWSMLLDYWYYTNYSAHPSVSDNLYYFSDSTKRQAFMNYFNIPFAGYRSFSNASLYSQGDNGYYWSSSPRSASSSGARYLNLNLYIVGVMGSRDLRAYGFSVRCFKNEYVAPTPQSIEITYDPNGGAFSGKAVDETTVVTYTKNASGTYEPDINIQFPNKVSDNMSVQSGWMFDGWYTDTNYTTEWLGYVDSSTQSQTVYAKWLPFENKTVDLGEIGSFDIMDRNMGAEAVSDGAYNNTTANQLGYYYQWGNNYGFKNSGTPNISDGNQIDITGKGYGPGNYYSSATFVKYGGKWDIDNSTSTYTSYGNLNLWGGENTSNPDSWRQGPCPENYHVPDTLEWKAAYELFKSWANTTAGQAYCATFTDDNTTYRPKCFASKLALPFAGFRLNDDSSVYSQGTNGLYWSSSPYPSSADNSYLLDFNSSDVYPQGSYGRAYGFSVRCFKNSSTQALTFSRNGEIIDTKNVRRWEPITTSYKPANPSGTTENWYTDSELTSQFTFGNTTYVTEAKTLYSKITCNNSSYIWNGTECVQQFTVTLNATANGGTITPTSVTVANGSQFPLENYIASKDGYTFEGWAETSGTTGVLTSNPTITANKTLYAVFKKNLTATFTIQDINAATQEGGTTSCTLWNMDETCNITSPTLNAENGYSALGWNAGSGATESSLNSNTSTSISSNVTYYSITKSDDKVLHITYTKGKGVAEIGKTEDFCTLTGTYNGAPQATSCTVTAPSITPKSGYENEIWTESGTNHTVPELGTITLTEDLHLTASAEYEASSTAEVYNIAYYLNGEGTLTGQRTTYTVDDTFTLVEPTRTGYKFIGWTGSNGDTPQTGVVILSGTTGNLEFTANWTCAEGYTEVNGVCVVKTNATLLSGCAFNAVIKNLANNSTIYGCGREDTKIKRISRSVNPPSAGVHTGLISTDDSENEIIAWYSMETLYYYTQANTIYMNSDSSSMFSYLSYLVDVSGLSDWNASNVTNMHGMFNWCRRLTSLSGLDYWDTSNLIDMSSMFWDCEKLTDVSALSNWNTSNVKDMSWMFERCLELEEVDFTHWNTINVEDMGSMFWECHKLVNISGVTGWNTSNVKDMSWMFHYCNSLDILDLSRWNTNNVTEMKYMFSDCTSLDTLDLNGWDTRNVTGMNGMFEDCSNLTTIYASSGFVVNNVTDSDGMFSNVKLVGGNGTKYRDIFVEDKTYAKIDTQSQSGYFTDKTGSIIVRFMVGGNEYYTTSVNYGGKVTSPDTSSLEGFEGWYYEGEQFNFDNKIEKYTEIYAKGIQSTDAILLPGDELQAKIKSLAGLPDVSDVTKISRSTTHPGAGVDTVVISTYNSLNDVVAWYDSGVLYYYTQAGTIYMNPDSSYMFKDFENLADISGLSDWDASNVINMRYMFWDCENLTDISALSSWNTSRVTNMDSMFGFLLGFDGSVSNKWMEYEQSYEYGLYVGIL